MILLYCSTSLIGFRGITFLIIRVQIERCMGTPPMGLWSCLIFFSIATSPAKPERGLVCVIIMLTLDHFNLYCCTSVSSTFQIVCRGGGGGGASTTPSPGQSYINTSSALEKKTGEINKTCENNK